ncbi:MAG: phosphoribosylaminoimidazolesuccinocarboxamide synthase [Candidatus Omnitrophota bacterium]|nr:phosphoribosylaminoimidazolesuccinocarboxamide synthase [Candidatus Omnitrophota bacterium]
MSKILLSTNFSDLKPFKTGKVRDVYEVGENLLVISTDRISAFDVILPNGIPHKGEVLNKISLFWFEFTKDIIPNHVIAAEVEKYPVSLKKYKDILGGRSMLVKKTKPVSFECVVRGYLSGSAYKEYVETGTVSGIKLPAGLKESDKFPKPIFTPATKEERGHDINVDEAFMAKNMGVSITTFIKEVSLKIYEKAAKYAEKKGIIIADTKFEFGFNGDKIILIDEVLTPDSSRFWPKATYRPGGPQASYDKQFVRDYLESITWDKNPPAPQLPPDVIAKTEEKYKEALKALTGITV